MKNTIYNMLGTTFIALMQFLLLPLIYHSLGVERFGIWALISIFVAFFTTLDFGTGCAFQKFFSEYYTKRDFDSFNQVMNVGLLFLFLISTLGGLCIYIFRMKIVAFFNIPKEMTSEAVNVFIFTAIIFAYSNITSIFNSAIKGIQRMEWVNGIQIISFIIYVSGVVILLKRNYSLYGLVIMLGIRIFIVSLLSYWILHFLIPQFKFRLTKINFSNMVKFINYGLKMQISNLANLINSQTDKTIIGYKLNLLYVTTYEVGQKFASLLKMATGIILSALLPAITELDTFQKNDELRLVYQKGSKYLISTLLPFIVFLFFFVHELMYCWIGEILHDSKLVAQILITGIAVNSLTGIGVMVVRGIGEPGKETRYAIVSLFSNIILSLVFINIFGFWGVVFASPIAILIGSIYFLIVFHRQNKIQLINFIKVNYFKPLLFSISIFLLFSSLHDYTIDKFGMEFSRLLLLLLLGVYFLALSFLYFFLLKIFNFWDSFDITVLRKIKVVILKSRQTANFLNETRG